jgi:hypothetical protein
LRVKRLAVLGVGLCLWATSACDGSNTVIAIWAPASAGAGGAGNSSGGAAGSLISPAGSAGADAAAGASPVADAGQALQPEAFYVEAEQGVLSGAFTIASAATPAGQIPSGEYIEASEEAPDGNAPGVARALYTFSLGSAGDYVIWGRIHSPDASHNRFWFRVDEQTWFLWRLSTGDVWYWDDLHNNTDYNVALVFSLAAGPHRLELANAVSGARLDRLYITSAGDTPPGNDTACSPPHSIELAGACVRSCGSHAVDVTCDPAVCATREALEAYDCGVCCVP